MPVMRQRTPQMKRAPWMAKCSHTVVRRYSGVPRRKIEPRSDITAHGMTETTSQSTNSAERSDQTSFCIS
jgi:hypothetical protein